MPKDGISFANHTSPIDVLTGSHLPAKTHIKILSKIHWGNLSGAVPAMLVDSCGCLPLHILVKKLRRDYVHLIISFYLVEDN